MNVLTQLWSVDQLLNANYYIADCGSPSMNVSLTESVRYNDYGQVIEDDPISRTPSVVVPGVGRYNIKYSNGGLNPERYRADCLMGINDDYSSSYDNVFAEVLYKFPIRVVKTPTNKHRTIIDTTKSYPVIPSSFFNIASSYSFAYVTFLS